jgi:acyl-CoA synthetase (AMP-forming)/AMP-acid ligase II
MENRSEFVWHYLAAGKLGVVVAFVNTRARGDGLAHALSACGANHMIVDSECLPAFLAIRSHVADELVNRCLVDEDEKVAACDASGLARFVPSATSTNPPETSGHTLGDRAPTFSRAERSGSPRLPS